MKHLPQLFKPRADQAPANPAGSHTPQPPLPEDLVKRLAELIPSMRAYARGVCGERAAADRACERALMAFAQAAAPPANDAGLQTRLFRQLRQDCRQALAEQAAAMKPQGLQGRVAGLPIDLSEALALVGGLGMSLTEAGAICDCSPEEIARRLAEARTRLSGRQA